MRIVFSAVGAYGHLFPIVPCALAAAEAGHEVVVAVPEPYQAELDRAGLATMAAGISVREAITAANDRLNVARSGDGRISADAFGTVLPRQAVADLRPLLADGHIDLVVYEALNPGAGIAAALTGVPAICHGIGRVSGSPAWSAMCDAWRTTAAQFGMDLPEDYPPSLGFPVIDICPPSFQDFRFRTPAEHLLTRPVPWSPAGSLPPIARRRPDRRPLIYLTLGTAFVRQGILELALAGLSTLPAEVIVSGGGQVGPKDFGALPDNVKVCDWVPQAELLPLVDLVVSHGGSGTTLGALAHGLPHLVVPQGADQFANALAVADAGVGEQIRPDELTAGSVADRARWLMTDEGVRERLDVISAEVATMPSPAETVKRLERLAG
jgi:UDP:flavonoid glycosyltransferase YjiC (YdhE family)